MAWRLRYFLLLLISLCLTQQAVAVQFINDMLSDTNKIRVKHGRKVLALDKQLCKIATRHSAYMAANKELSHDGFYERSLAINSTKVAENVTQTLDFNSDSIVSRWMRNNGPHARNLLDPDINLMGVGYSGPVNNIYYVTIIYSR